MIYFFFHLINVISAEPRYQWKSAQLLYSYLHYLIHNTHVCRSFKFRCDHLIFSQTRIEVVITEW